MRDLIYEVSCSAWSTKLPHESFSAIKDTVPFFH